jgi:hypothetical protein
MISSYLNTETASAELAMRLHADDQNGRRDALNDLYRTSKRIGLHRVYVIIRESFHMAIQQGLLADDRPIISTQEPGSGGSASESTS